MSKYVIVGAGIAGVTAAELLRKRNPECDIVLIGQETHAVYSRVLLPHYILGKVPRERVFLKKSEWYEENNITYMSGIDAIELDLKNQFVRTSEEREIPYDKLLITTGGTVRLLPDDIRGVSYFRTLEDTDHLLELIKSVKALPKENQRGIVYGAGFIALEYINIFAHYSIPTTVIVRSSGFWTKALSPHSQKVLANHAKKHGIEIIKNQSHLTLLGEKELTGVELEDGTKIDAQILGTGIGLVPDKQWLKDSGLLINQGILVNEYLETNIPNVYSAGDVCEFYDCIVDRQFVLGNWMNAQMQARAVAKTITGERTKFELVSSYAANLLGKEIVFIGDTSREHADEIIQHIADEENSTELFLRNGTIVGAILIESVSARTIITQAIKDRETYKHFIS